MRRFAGPMASVVLLVACNALTGVSDLTPCTARECDDPDAALAPDAPRDAFVAPLDGSTAADARDAALAPDVGTEAGAEAGIGCQGAADCTRVAFVTSVNYDGNLGGVAGADAKCQALADASPLARIKGRTFLAWVSTTTTSPATRFVHGTNPYVRPDNSLIASSWNDLTDGNLANGISMNDIGGTKNGSDAWTGTSSVNAGFTGDSCTDWTSATFVTKGTTGNVGGSGGGWSSSGPNPCLGAFALYCFEY